MEAGAWDGSDVARHLADLDIDEIWQEATEPERWIIASDLLDEIAFYPDHLEVKVSGAPRMDDVDVIARDQT